MCACVCGIPCLFFFPFFSFNLRANAWNLERVKVVPLLFDPSFVVNDRAEMSREMEQSVIKSGSSNFVEIIADVRKNLERSLERELVRSAGKPERCVDAYTDSARDATRIVGWRVARGLNEQGTYGRGQIVG